MTTPRMPKGFGAAGQKLWRTVNAEFELDYEPHKVELLAQACRVVDSIAELDREAARQPLTVRGSVGQTTINPIRSEARFQRGLLAQLLGRLGLPDTDEAQADKAQKLSQTRRQAAKSKAKR